DIFFANFADQRLYRQGGQTGGAPEPMTAAAPMRYADCIVDAARERLICVREDHSAPGEPVNTLAAVPWHGADTGVVLAQGSDFVAAPRLSPSGQSLAWISW